MNRNRKNELTIKIKVEPRSSKTGIVGPHGDALKIKLTSPPVEGKANKELIDVLARELKVKKKDIEIVSGQSSKNKVVRINGITSIEERIKK
ncbi:MAG: YggU family protein [Nitrospiraceae bacterium]|nr:MAG: YggU family protein [Nitrospiraceae bacterium]UCH44842.1 MAG: YggU family protein [Nitrospiraceae bacterium]